MDIEPLFRLDEAIVGPSREQRFVVLDQDDRFHEAATGWLGFLHNIGRSPNTVEAYGSRVAWYLSWTALTSDWRSIGISHLAMWKNIVTTTPVRKTNGQEKLRSPATVGLWMIPVRSFYEWSDSQGLLTTDVASQMTKLKYYAPGTPGGGEHGATRQVLVDELRPMFHAPTVVDPEWIDDAGARERLELLDLNVRDRFLLDLLYFTGIRVGEAMSLFAQDMHFGGGSAALGCRLLDPHFHVRMNNPVENRARAKGCERVLMVTEHLVERYVDYLLERQAILGDDDVSPHVFVNLYTRGARQGAAMRESGVRKIIDRVGARIGFDISGPHMLRHTLATRLVRGIDCEPQPLDVVGHILGHLSEASTGIYTHDRERAKRKALAAIAPRTVLLGL